MCLFGGIVACAGIAATGQVPSLWMAVLAFGVLFGTYPERVCAEA